LVVGLCVPDVPFKFFLFLVFLFIFFFIGGVQAGRLCVLDVPDFFRNAASCNRHQRSSRSNARRYSADRGTHAQEVDILVPNLLHIYVRFFSSNARRYSADRGTHAQEVDILVPILFHIYVRFFSVRMY